MKNLLVAAATAAVWLATPAWADPFVFNTGNPDGRLGALSQPAGSGKLETETADDFILTETTSIAQATITGLIPPGTPLTNITNVEVEVYHVFSKDSAIPPSGNVPSRVNSPADVEIDVATRDGGLGTLDFTGSLLNSSFSVANTVVNGINKKPNNTTLGDGPATGEEVEITITFTPPILLPPDHYFFRPEVQVAGGDFLYLSAPRPIVSPGTPFTGDLQAWIRNSALAPDWLRIGTDIIGGSPAPTFSMTFSLTGDTVPQAGTPGQPDCRGKTLSALSHQFGTLRAAATALGFPSDKALQDAVQESCDLVQTVHTHVVPPPVPANLQVPAGNTAFLVGHAVGTQNYICLPSGSGFAFTLFTPEATLFDDGDKQLITHFFSPNLSPIPPEVLGTIRATWEHSRDTSTVWASATPDTTSTDPAFVAPGAIAWLLLNVVGAQDGPTGGHTLTATTFVQRLNTSGGVAPSSGCASSADVGNKAFVQYTADYFFYKGPKSAADSGN
jgi:uncharacterized protein DUF3455